MQTVQPVAVSNRCAWLLPLSLVLAGVLAYINTLPNVFIFDDVPWVLKNPRVQSLSNILEMFTATNRPVLEVTLAINYAIGGEAPAGYRVLNMAIHILAALTLFGLARRTLQLPKFAHRFQGNAHYLAFMIAMLWLLHPLNTQSVSYLIQRGESLMGLCYLFTLYSFLRYATGEGRRWAVAAVAVCWVGMGTKEVMATAPLVVLLFDATFIAQSWREPFAKRRGFYLALITAWVPMAFFLATIVNSGPDASAGFALEEKLLTRWTYLLTQAQVIVEVYLFKAFWPSPLVLDYGWVPAIPRDTPSGEVMRLFIANVLWQGLVVLALLGVSIWGMARRVWWGFLGMSFFLILAPTSSIMPIADLAVEHRMYLSLISVVVCVVVAGHMLLRRMLGEKAPLYGLTILVVLVPLLCLRTVTRNFEYRTRVSVWDSVVVARPYNARGWHNLASALNDEGRQEEAMICYEQTLKIVPSYADAQYGIGAIWLERGELEMAIQRFQAANELAPEDAASHAQLGKAFLLAGRLDEAEHALLRATELSPEYGRAFEYLGLLNLARGDLPAAIQLFRRAIEYEPGLKASYFNLAAALADEGQWQDAILVIDSALSRAKELGLTGEDLQGLKARRDRYRGQALQAPASP